MHYAESMNITKTVFFVIGKCDGMKYRLHTADPAGISRGSKGTSLHTFNDNAAKTAAVVLMYGFRKRHGERRLKQGL